MRTVATLPDGLRQYGPVKSVSDSVIRLGPPSPYYL